MTIRKEILKKLKAQEEEEGLSEDVLAVRWFVAYATSRMQFSSMVDRKAGSRRTPKGQPTYDLYKPTETLLGMYQSKLGEIK